MPEKEVERYLCQQVKKKLGGMRSLKSWPVICSFPG